MAMTYNGNHDSSSVQGKVFNSASKQGIGSLLVNVYGLNGSAERGRKGDLDALLENSTRLGSVLSNEGGTFTVNYSKDDMPPPQQ